MVEHYISVENSPKLLKITMIFWDYHENDTANKDVEDFMAGAPFPFRNYTLPFQKAALHIPARLTIAISEAPAEEAGLVYCLNKWTYFAFMYNCTKCIFTANKHLGYIW